MVWRWDRRRTERRAAPKPKSAGLSPSRALPWSPPRLPTATTTV